MVNIYAQYVCGYNIKSYFSVVCDQETLKALFFGRHIGSSSYSQIWFSCILCLMAKRHFFFVIISGNLGYTLVCSMRVFCIWVAVIPFFTFIFESSETCFICLILSDLLTTTEW